MFQLIFKKTRKKEFESCLGSVINSIWRHRTRGETLSGVVLAVPAAKINNKWSTREAQWANINETPQLKTQTDLGQTVKAGRLLIKVPPRTTMIGAMAQAVTICESRQARVQNAPQVKTRIAPAATITCNRCRRQLQLTSLRSFLGAPTATGSSDLEVRCQLGRHCTTCRASALTTSLSFKFLAVRNMPPLSQVSG